MLAVATILNFSTTTSSNPVVTLRHGGQLRGLTAPFGSSMIDAFIGVRYAEPPVGNLRFKKPLEAEAWSGLKEANQTGSVCFQGTPDGRTVGSEDCLYLNIYRPAQNASDDSKANKAVMVWIHGGGYVQGSGNEYPGAPLSANGDVIVITINYRLGAFGFLADELGNGNFGLWDQRAALQWIQKNIGAFGGDPDKVTIFGQSGGAASVSALMMSKRTDGLFARGIQQSGSLQIPGWYSSEKNQQLKRTRLRANTNCSPGTRNIFSCFVGLTSEQAFAASIYATNPILPSWAPTADNDFFPSDISEEGFSPSQKYDLLAGFNAQEGRLFLTLSLRAFPDVNITNGVSQEMAERILSNECSRAFTPNSPAMCQYFLDTLYRLKHSRSDRVRAIRLTDILGEVNINADIQRQIEKSSEGNHSTYAYYYTQLLPPSLFGSLTPDWLRQSADHGEELPLVFGLPALKQDANTIWSDIIGSDPATSSILDTSYPPSLADFSDTVMTMWTNFATSGNPNKPKELPRGVPRWPEYSKYNSKFMQLHSNYTGLIRTPHKSRLEAVRKNLLSATRLQYLADNQQCV